MKTHTDQETSDHVTVQLSIWISGLTFVIVLLLGSLMIDIKTDVSIIQYQLKDLSGITKTVNQLEYNQGDIKESMTEILKTLKNGK